MVPAMNTSLGMEPPMLVMPMNSSSREAPKARPVAASPNTMPRMGHTTMGRVAKL